MRKGSFAAVWFLVIVFSAAMAHAQVVKTITFQFEKAVVEADLDHFRLELSTDATFQEPWDATADPASGTWEFFADIPFEGGLTVYTHSEPLETPAHQETQYWFRIRAEDRTGNPSDWCYGHDEGPCTFKADNLGPGMLIQFKIIAVEKQE